MVPTVAGPDETTGGEGKVQFKTVCGATAEKVEGKTHSSTTTGRDCKDGRRAKAQRTAENAVRGAQTSAQAVPKADVEGQARGKAADPRAPQGTVAKEEIDGYAGAAARCKTEDLSGTQALH